MRKLLAAAIIISIALSLSACGRPMEICRIVYQPYGLLNVDDKKNDHIEYEVIWGNVIWGAVLAETIVAPIYFFGFSIFNPVGPKSKIKGAIGQPHDCQPKDHAP